MMDLDHDNSEIMPTPQLLLSGHSVNDEEDDDDVLSSEDKTIDVPVIAAKKAKANSMWQNNRDTIFNGEFEFCVYLQFFCPTNVFKFKHKVKGKLFTI